jgi:riboflavin biosynthesis pyrimidine reductase
VDFAALRFRDVAARKTAAAEAARIVPLKTTADHSGVRFVHHIGNDWTRLAYDGDFHLFPAPADVPAVSLVFVQSRDRNTGVDNPEELGGGATDTHLIYEGLSRVAADGVLAGATTAAGPDVFFSVWHPELVALRRELGLPRHPAQIVVSQEGRADLNQTLLFNVPDVPVFVLAGEVCRRTCAEGFARRPWIRIIPIGPDGLAGAMRSLRQTHGISRISTVGGRATASSLIDAGLVQDVCLTTTARSTGGPATPFYIGPKPLSFDLIVSKTGTDPAAPMVFEHVAVPTTPGVVFREDPRAKNNPRRRRPSISGPSRSHRP